MGYVEESTSCYKIWNLASRKLTISRDVIFEEESTVKSEGSGGMKEEDYYTILPVAENANPSGMIEHAPPDQAEDDDHIQPPEDAADSIEEFFYAWEDPQREAPIPQLRRSSRIPKPTERYRCLIGDPSHLPTSTTNAEEASSPSTKIF
ncbi:hypothetical protein DAPPUDRAFT_334657, partial [Daphnia pulex]